MVSRLIAQAKGYLRRRAIRKRIDQIREELSIVTRFDLPEEVKAQIILNLLKKIRELEVEVIEIKDHLTLREL